MDINKMKTTSFERVGLQEWKAKAEESLKGRPIDQLYKETYEGITLKPLYTKEDIDKKQSTERHSSKRDWKVAQRVTAEDEDSLPERLSTALTRGQDTVSFTDYNGSLSKNVMEKIFTLAIKEKAPLFHIASLDSEGFSLLKEGYSRLTGVFGADPVTDMVVKDSSETMNTWIEHITYLNESAPELRTIVVDTSSLNEAGANAIQEMAYALAAGVAVIEKLKKEGWTAEQAAGKLIFNFSIGSSFFTEISKLRAFRTLWKNVAEAYELNDTEAVLSAETSVFTKSKLDPYVNMLRAGNETFSAVLGGADYIHTAPFDEVSGTTSPFSERIARNTQLILSHESHLNKVSDPAGGSYYIESLTNTLAEQAWKKFQELDGNGGLIKVLRGGTLQNDIKLVFDRRQKDVAIRKQNLIGTNVFSNLEESPAGNLSSEQKQPPHGIKRQRLSADFENLRERALSLKDKPLAGLILLGKIKQHKARADFVSGFLAAGGIGVLPSRECLTVEDAAAFTEELKADYFVICGRDEDYEAMAKEILASIKREGRQIDLAGRLSKDAMEELQEAGLDSSIYLGQNMTEKLDALLRGWEGTSNEK
ncbi:methylmalonyl-CoA mutase [Rossellomorea vietnamensis]|uniref:methylmalonyl-CoA mutase n=1 Tax=Rossellomorea vietnamensis TaxID=218284 RepID=A0A5D4NZA5_9BACI|nr:methylmalonyl-CoA mutase family protein [Rossellomorea vietnamensis]TYS19061.1 methylmalonyl-CoA mutase [Rossellomorea vietnamensis]